MKKVTIKNRKNQKLVVLVEEAQHPKGLAIVMHGLSGNKEQPHIKTFAEAFREKNYTVIRFDTTNTFGESDGRYEDATVTNYLSDLEDVITWVKKQPFYVKPFFLAGHSLGSIAIILYSQKHPNTIKGLAPISAVISGKLSLETPKYKNTWRNWKKTGWKEEISKRFSASYPWKIKRLPWAHMEDRLKYNVLLKADKLTMPVLLIVGDKDDSTPYKHQKLLYDLLPGKKEIHIIKNAPHTFTENKHLKEIKNIFKNWLVKF